MKRLALEAQGLTYSYVRNQDRIPILKEVDFQLYQQQQIALVGDSGAGKSTFLHLLGLLDTPLAGNLILYDNHRPIQTTKLSDAQRAALRGTFIGFIYQFHHLLNEFTALENVIIPQIIAKTPLKVASAHAKELLHLVGLDNRINHRPSQLSGGQQQRVAIARALANRPSILLADEPTGSLDEHTAQDILSVFLTLTQEHRLSVIMATHNHALCQQFDRVISLHGGKLWELEVR